MKCQLCEKDSAFLCFCKNLYLCKMHFSEHLLVKGDHKYECLLIALDSQEKIKFQEEIKKRISLLSEQKRSLITQTEKLLKSIKAHQISTIKTLNDLIKTYKNHLKKQEFRFSEIKEVRYLIKSQMMIHQLSLEDLIKEVEKFYPKHFISFKLDPKEEKSIRSKFFESHNSGFYCLALSSDTKMILTGSEDGTVRTWDLNNMKQTACFDEHKAPVHCLDISNDSSLALSASFDKSVILWDLRNLCMKIVYSGHEGPVCSVSFDSNQSFVISASRASEIILWDLESGIIQKKIISNEMIYSGIIFGKLYITTGGKSLEFWDLCNYSRVQIIQAHSSRILSIAITPNKQNILTGSEDKLVKIWNASTILNQNQSSLKAILSGHQRSVRSLSGTSNEDLILSGSEDFSIILWSISSKTIVHTFCHHSDAVYGLKSTNDSIFSVSLDGRIGISSLTFKMCESYLNLKTFRTHSMLQKENFFAYGNSNDVMFWNADQHESEKVFKGHLNPVGALCFSPNKDFLITASRGDQKNLIIWDLELASMRGELEGHENNVLCIDISKDQLNALTGDVKSKLVYWDLCNFTKIYVMEEKFSAEILTVKIAGNKKFAVSGGIDKVINVWDVDNRCLYTKLFAHCDVVWKVLFTCDDLFVVSADYFHGIYVWSIQEKCLKYQFKKISEAEYWLSQHKEVHSEIIKFLV